MSDLLRLIKTTGIYLLGSILTKSLSFLLLPLLTLYLSPQEYGTYDLYVAYITLLSSVLFLDIWGGILRFMFDYKEEKEKYNPIRAGVLIFILSSIVYIIATFLLGALFNLEHVFILLIFGLCNNIQMLFGNIARGFGKDFIFAISGLLGSIVIVACNILFIAVLHKGYEYLFISSSIGFVFIAVIIATKVKIIDQFKPNMFDKRLFREILIYSLPLSVNSVAWWFLNSYNRLVINSNFESTDNGLYAVALKFGVMVQVFVQCFQLAWQELSFSKSNITVSEKQFFYSTAFHEFVKLLGLGTILLLPLIKLLFPIMIDESYYDAQVLVPIILLSTLLTSISSFLASICGSLKITNNILVTTIYGSIANVIAVHLLISYTGLQAPGIALSIGFLIVVIFRFRMINKHFKITIYWNYITALFIGFAIISIVYLTLNVVFNAVVFIILCCIVVLIYFNKLKEIIMKISSKV